MKYIKNLEQLNRLVENKKSIICLGGGMFSNKSFPAAFVINIAGARLLYLFRYGMIEYKPKKKRGK